MAAFLTPKEIVGKIDGWGRAKASLPLNRLLGLGVLAGLFISIGATLCLLVVTSSMLGLGPTRLLGGAVFSLGLMLVILAGAELSTGNCLLVIPWSNGRLTTMALLRNWGVSFLTNCLGAVLFVMLVAKSGLLDSSDLQQTAKRVAEAKLALEPVPAFVRGILCNMLVCLAVWMSFAATTAPGKMFAVIMPIAAFVALGFEHSVANVFLLPLGVLAGADGTYGMFVTNIGMVTLGNLVGGAVIAWLLGALHAPAPENATADGDVPADPAVWRHRLAATAVVIMVGWLLLLSRHVHAVVVVAEAGSPPVARQESNIQRVDMQTQLKRLEDRHEASDVVAKRLQLLIEVLISETTQLKVAAIKAAGGDQVTKPAYGSFLAKDEAGGQRDPGTGELATTAKTTVPKSCPDKDALLTELPVLRFARNQETLDPVHRRQLDRIAALGAVCPALSLTIESHTDNRGSERANLKLSRYRGALIAEYLSARGLDPGQIRVVAHGDRRPLLPNGSEETRNLNRRAELTLSLQ